MEQGYSTTALAGHLGVARSTVYLWMDENPEFSDAVKDARRLSQAWWEDLGQNMALTGEGNPTAFIFQVKNRFSDDYRDKIDHGIGGIDGGPMKVVSRVELVAVQPDDHAED
jgi:hypothetical protein